MKQLCPYCLNNNTYPSAYSFACFTPRGAPWYCHDCQREFQPHKVPLAISDLKPPINKPKPN